MINLDDISIGDNNRRTLFLNKLERDVDYCDNSTIDGNYYRKVAIDSGEDKIFLRGNIVTDPNSSPTLSDGNYLIAFQNSDCDVNEDVCKNGTFKEELGVVHRYLIWAQIL